MTTALATDRIDIRFAAPFDLALYQTFLRCKALPESDLSYRWEDDSYTLSTPARYAHLIDGRQPAAEPDPLPLAPHLFDYQQFIVRKALEARRYAAWCDTGLGKTLIELEFARLVAAMTGGRVLLMAPLAIIEQTREEAARWYGDTLAIERLDSREAIAAWCAGSGAALAITNPDKLIAGIIPEMRRLAGFVLDESSLLKTGGGVIKWNCIKSTTGIPYKLSCTATPAPNEAMEYASQARFLEMMRSEGEVLWTFFSRDKRGDWRVKPHAQGAFYRFMAAWSIYLRNPAHYGWGDILATLPPPVIHEETLELTPEQRIAMHDLQVRAGSGMLGSERMGIKERSKLSQLAKGFLYQGSGAQKAAVRIPSLKPARVAQLAVHEVFQGRPCIIWTVFDEETAIIAEHLRPLVGARFAVLDGSTKDADRTGRVRDFRLGNVDILVTRAQLAGYGLNLQHARSMVFSGFDDSFERMYQAIRRAYRFGQTETVHVHVPVIPELEGLVFDNVKAKEAQFEADVEAMERHYIEAMQEQEGTAA